jgi:hypothetical protein
VSRSQWPDFPLAQWSRQRSPPLDGLLVFPLPKNIPIPVYFCFAIFCCIFIQLTLFFSHVDMTLPLAYLRFSGLLTRNYHKKLWQQQEVKIDRNSTMIYGMDLRC